MDEDLHRQRTTPCQLFKQRDEFTLSNIFLKKQFQLG